MTVKELVSRLSTVNDGYKVMIDVRYNVLTVKEVNIKYDAKGIAYVELR